MLQARDAVLDRLTRDRSAPRTWYVRVSPSATDLARATQVVRVDADRAECHRRVDEAGRPARWHQLIDQWFGEQA